MKLKISLGITVLFIAAILIIVVAPNYYYFKVLKTGSDGKFFKLKNYKPRLAKPGRLIGEEPGRVDNPELWKQFHVRDVIIPLPVRHPLYFVSPIIKHNKSNPDLGVRILKPDGRELAQIVFLPTDYLSPKLDGQKLFEIPIFRSKLEGLNQNRLWTDLFNKDLSKFQFSVQELIYNLFLLDLRHKFFPQEIQNFHLSKDKKFALIEVASKNRDYRTELVLNYQDGVILSYIIITDRQTEGALSLRNYFLNNIRLEPGSISLSKIIYREYQTLTYPRRIDLEGMTYLFSAWSHETQNREFIRTMIEGLERGAKKGDHTEQLKELYIYAYEKYNTTFSELFVEIKDLPEDVKLLRNLELEKKQDLVNEKLRVIPSYEKKASKKDVFFQRLKKGKLKLQKKLESKKIKKIKVD